MEIKKRAIRRHNNIRMLNRAIHIWKDRNNPIDIARRTYNNLAVCSCWMCGNPRRSCGSNQKERITIAEQVNYLKFKEEIEEYKK